VIHNNYSLQAYLYIYRFHNNQRFRLNNASFITPVFYSPEFHNAGWAQIMRMTPLPDGGKRLTICVTVSTHTTTIEETDGQKITIWRCLHAVARRKRYLNSYVAGIREIRMYFGEII